MLIHTHARATMVTKETCIPDLYTYKPRSIVLKFLARTYIFTSYTWVRTHKRRKEANEVMEHRQRLSQFIVLDHTRNLVPCI